MIRKEIEFEIYIWRGGEVVTLRSAKPTCAGSIPAHASNCNFKIKIYNSGIARVAELVYAHDLKSCLARDVGSIPTSGTSFLKFKCALSSAGRADPS